MSPTAEWKDGILHREIDISPFLEDFGTHVRDLLSHIHVSSHMHIVVESFFFTVESTAVFLSHAVVVSWPITFGPDALLASSILSFS